MVVPVKVLPLQDRVNLGIAQSAEAVEYDDCFSAER